MTSVITGKHARIVVLMTGLIAFTSIAVAALMAARLSRARTILHAKLQQCECCDDLKPIGTK